MHHWLRFIFGRTATNSFITIGANMVYGLLLMAFFALASRLLGPDKFGLLSITLALFAISFDILSLGTTQALVRFVSLFLARKQYSRAEQTAGFIFKLRLLEAVGLVVAAIFIGKLVAVNFYHQLELVIPLSLTLALTGGILLVDFFISLLQAYEKFTQAAGLLVSLAAFKLLFLFGLIFINQTSLTAVTLAFVTTPLLVSVIGLIISPKKFLFTPVTARLIPGLVHFSKWMALWGITATLSGRIDILLLGKLTSSFETGIYAAASRVATGFILVGSSFASVLSPKISRLAHHKLELQRQFFLMVKVVAGLILGMIVVAAVSPWFIPLIFGSHYLQSVLVFQSLTLALIFFMASIPANVSLLALGHSRWLGLLSLGQLVIMVGVSWRLIPLNGAQGAAAALLLAYASTWILSTSIAIKKIFW